MPWAESGNVVLLYDGACGMCRRFAGRVKALDAENRVELVTLQDAHREGRTLGLDDATFWVTPHLRLPDGTVRSGAALLEPLFARLPLAVPAAWAFRHVPGAHGVAAWLYARALARHGGPAEPYADDGAGQPP